MLTLGTPRDVNPVEDLLFDPDNPRLPQELQGSSDQAKLLRHLYEEEGVEDILKSILQNGFLSTDPILVVKAGGNKYTVIEGNRRLAAISYLLSNQLRTQAGLAPPSTVTQKAIDSLKEITVLEVASASDPEVVAYLGYKHVTGARPWGPEEKARYVQTCLLSGDYDPDTLAAMLGVAKSDLNRPLSALRIINQAKTWGVYDFFQDRKVKRAFGTLYTAFSYKGFRYYLQITDASAFSEDPVPESSKERLGEVLLWLFGSKRKNIDPKLPESRRLSDLDKILLDEDATDAIREGASIDDAFLLTDAAGEYALQEIREIELKLRRLLVSLYTMRGNTKLIQASKKLAAACEEISRTLEEGE